MLGLGEVMGSPPARPPPEFGSLLGLLDQLREMDRRAAMSSTAATLGHVIGTPLNVIAGRAALIRSGQDPASAAENARRIEEQVDRLAARVHALIGHLHERAPDVTPTSAATVVADCMALYGPIAAERRVEVSLDGDVPRAQLAEGTMATVVLTSVLSLALRHAAPATVITLRASKGDENATTFAIEAPSLQPPAGPVDRMEPPEARADRADDRLQVMSLAYSTAKRFGGALSVAARAEGGSLIELTWPAS